MIERFRFGKCVEINSFWKIQKAEQNPLFQMAAAMSQALHSFDSVSDQKPILISVFRDFSVNKNYIFTQNFCVLVFISYCSKNRGKMAIIAKKRRLRKNFKISYPSFCQKLASATTIGSAFLERFRYAR